MKKKIIIRDNFFYRRVLFVCGSASQPVMNEAKNFGFVSETGKRRYLTSTSMDLFLPFLWWFLELRSAIENRLSHVAKVHAIFDSEKNPRIFFFFFNINFGPRINGNITVSVHSSRRLFPPSGSVVRLRLDNWPSNWRRVVCAHSEFGGVEAALTYEQRLRWNATRPQKFHRYFELRVYVVIRVVR